MERGSCSLGRRCCPCPAQLLGCSWEMPHGPKRRQSLFSQSSVQVTQHNTCPGQTGLLLQGHTPSQRPGHPNWSLSIGHSLTCPIRPLLLVPQELQTGEASPRLPAFLVCGGKQVRIHPPYAILTRPRPQRFLRNKLHHVCVYLCRGETCSHPSPLRSLSSLGSWLTNG